MDITKDMESLSMRKLIFKMSVPTIISMLALALYNLVDAAFVSKVSADGLTAISLAYPVQSIMTAIALGTAIGANSILSRKLGEKNDAEANKIIANTFTLNFIGWIFAALFGYFCVEPFLRFFVNNERVIEYGVTYLSICTIFSLGLFMQTTFEKIFEAVGKPAFSMIDNIAACVINIVLDYIFIFGFAKIPPMGVMGAAIATVIAQGCATLLGIIKISHLKLGLKFSDFLLNKEIVKEIYQVGFPTIVLESISAFVTIILNKIFGMFSEVSISVWGLYARVQPFLMMIVYGLNNAMVPIVAYNYGAKKISRVKEAFKIFMVTAELVMLAGMLFFIYGTDIILNIFNADTALYEAASVALKTLSFSFLIAGANAILSALYQAIGKGNYSLVIFVLRQLSINLPILYFVGRYYSLEFMWFGFVASEVLALVVALAFIKNIKKDVFEG